MSTHSGSLKKASRLGKPHMSNISQWSSVGGRSFTVRFVSNAARKSIMFQDKGVREALLKRENTKVILNVRGVFDRFE